MVGKACANPTRTRPNLRAILCCGTLCVKVAQSVICDGTLDYCCMTCGVNVQHFQAKPHRTFGEAHFSWQQLPGTLQGYLKIIQDVTLILPCHPYASVILFFPPMSEFVTLYTDMLHCTMHK